MPDIEVSEKAVATVEAENDKGIWSPVANGVFIGTRDEVKEQAEELKQKWLSWRWPADKIRVSIDTFRKQRNIHSIESAKEDLARD